MWFSVLYILIHRRGNQKVTFNGNHYKGLKCKRLLTNEKKVLVNKQLFKK